MFGTIAGGLIGLLGSVFVLILRWLGVKDATQQAVRAAIDLAVDDRRGVTLPGDVEDAALGRLEAAPPNAKPEDHSPSHEQ